MKTTALTVLEVLDTRSATHATPVSLRKRAAASLRARKGSRLTCLTGSLWVTRRGDPADYVLAAGESLALDSALVVQAIDEGSFRVA